MACSLDGYIAGPKGEFDWIPSEPEIDFDALYDQFDTFLMGRPFLPAPAPQRRLILRDQQVYRQSGIVLLTYNVLPPAS